MIHFCDFPPLKTQHVGKEGHGRCVVYVIWHNQIVADMIFTVVVDISMVTVSSTKSEKLLSNLRIVGSVMLLLDIANKTFFLM